MNKREFEKYQAETNRKIKTLFDENTELKKNRDGLKLKIEMITAEKEAAKQVAQVFAEKLKSTADTLKAFKVVIKELNS